MVINLPSHLDEEDLVSFGFLGLIEAVDKFNPKIGVKFETYASYRIKGKIIDEIRKANFLPRSTYKKLQAATDAYRRLEQLEGNVTEEKWAEASGMTLDELHHVLVNVSNLSFISLDEVIRSYDAKSIKVGDTVVSADAPDPQSIVENRELRILLKNALERLNEKDKLILALYYNEKLTLKEIGKVLNVSESRVCQLHGRAVLRLKAQLEEWNN
ncbi:MAG: FliA/WhiG family RNA polymerase sigma factor, partial [Desulfitobacteriaceae bacterium]|nr:FliA/WhiG family RNA polymerase sigma factor [Desulfitobacteriaceae bacterium]